MEDRFKFRAWDIKKKRMVLDACVLTETRELIKADGEFGDVFGFFDGVKWMQCTGLKDKNKNLIWEGDIVYNHNSFKYNDKTRPLMYLVIFKDGSFMFEAKNRERVSHLYWPGEMIKPDNWEILGNIHENPELLEPK